MTQPSQTVSAETLPDHVLVVEDDAVLGMVLEQALLDAGVAQVALSSSTEQAMQHLRQERPGAIVLDVHLADRDDGWAIAELVRTLGPNSPRIIFSTGAPLCPWGCPAAHCANPPTLFLLHPARGRPR